MLLRNEVLFLLFIRHQGSEFAVVKKKYIVSISQSGQLRFWSFNSWKIPIQVLVETSRDPTKLKKPKRNKGQVEDLQLPDESPSRKKKCIEEIVRILQGQSEQSCIGVLNSLN